MRNIIEALTRENAELAKKNGTARYAVLSPTDQLALRAAKTTADQLRSRIESLEAALLVTPDKAVAVQMLKQQLDLLPDRNRSDMDGIRDETVRLFTMVQWCMGILFTIGHAVLGIATNNMRKGKTESTATSSRAGA